MSSYELMQMESMLGGLMANFGSYIVAAVLSTVVLSYAMRWFIFQRAGEKGWKGIIPFYSDYVNYKIAWDGRIYLALLIAQIVSAILSAICGAINASFGMVIGVILNTAVMGMNAVAGMILQFKMARAFGRNDYFAIGLYFLGSVFTAILAFGDVQYKGPQTGDGIGVPKFIANIGQRAPQQPMQQAYMPGGYAGTAPQQPYAPGGYAGTAPQQPVQPQGYPPMQQGYQPAQQYQQGYQQAPAQRTGRRAMHNQYDQQ